MALNDLQQAYGGGAPPAPGTLATLCYQSWAADGPGPDELADLLATARERNRRFNVTGMLVHEGDRFFQWLEGPSAALGMLWTSINRDSRHKDVQLLGEGVTPVRLFSEWDLRFVERGSGEAEQASDAPTEAPESKASLMARLALAGDDEGMVALAREFAGEGHDAAILCRELFEPAAHQIGDWWCEDVCSSLEITLALGRLQSLVRRCDAGRPTPRRVAIKGRSILVSPPPHETHMLGATLLGGFFQRAGWSVQAEFPQEDPELMGLVGNQWFDALALTLSDVFTRRDRLAALIQTIKDARLAARNPNMAVIVGGRVFRPSDTDSPERVGADVHYGSAGTAVEDLDYWLFMHRFAAEKGRPSAGDAGGITTHEVVQAIFPRLKQSVDGIARRS